MVVASGNIVVTPGLFAAENAAAAVSAVGGVGAGDLAAGSAATMAACIAEAVGVDATAKLMTYRCLLRCRGCCTGVPLVSHKCFVIWDVMWVGVETGAAQIGVATAAEPKLPFRRLLRCSVAAGIASVGSFFVGSVVVGGAAVSTAAGVGNWRRIGCTCSLLLLGAWCSV